MGNALQISLERIVADPDQPRKSFPAEAIAELAESLKARGQLQPILVRWVEELSAYRVVAGNRRYLAARQANIASMQCVVLERDLTAVEVRTLQLIENIHREDLNALEKAHAFRDLMSDHQCSQRELARILHLDVATVSTTLALLGLPDEVQAQVANGLLAGSVASEIAKVDGARRQRELAERVLSEGLSRDQVRQQTRKPRLHRRAATRQPAPADRTATVVYNLPRGKVALSSERHPFTIAAQLALAEELVATLRAELTFNGPRDRAA
jgi:ParB family chromosome partitioning protein